MQAPKISRREPDELAARRNLKTQRRRDQLATRARIEAAQRRRRQLIFGGAAGAVVLALAALTYWLVHPEPGPEIMSFANQGQIHIQRGQSHPPYSSKPPTSGWHYGDAVAPWGVSSSPIPDEVQVHNLEHGGIVIQYDCPSGCPDMVTKLDAIVRSYPSKIVLAPYSGIDHRVALTAWTKLAYLDNVDEPFIRRFIARYKDKGPEFIPDTPG